MQVWKSKKVTLIALGLLVVFAGYMNWTYTGEVSDTMPTTAEYAEEENLGEVELVSAKEKESDYFAEARMDREEGRSRSVETLNALISNGDTSEEARRGAEAEVSAIAKNSDTEVVVENLIKAKGYEDAVVYIGDDSINVVVKSAGLKTEDISVIQEVVTGETGAGAEKIKIVEVN